MGIAVLLTAGGGASAQDDPPPDDLVPRTYPGELDDDTLDAQFQQLLDTYGDTSTGDGSSLTGPCGGMAYSYDGDGVLIDAAIDAGDDAPPIDVYGGGQAFTSDNPFRIDAGGQVVYYGFAPRAGAGPENHEWKLTIGQATVASGGDPNPNAKNRNAGVIDVGDELPLSFSAKFTAGGSMTSETLAPCDGKGHVELVGNGLLDPVGLGAMAIAGLGLLGLLFNARPARTWRGS